MTTSNSGADGLGRRFFEETPYGLSVEGHLDNTARLNTTFDNQGWLNAKQNVGLPCPGKPRPTWPPHWIYPLPRSNETELVRYPGTETRNSAFVPQIYPDFVPPNDRFKLSEDGQEVENDATPKTPSNDADSEKNIIKDPSTSMLSESTMDQKNENSDEKPMLDVVKTGMKQAKLPIVLIGVGGLVLLMIVLSMILVNNRKRF